MQLNASYFQAYCQCYQTIFSTTSIFLAKLFSISLSNWCSLSSTIWSLKPVLTYRLKQIKKISIFLEIDQQLWWILWGFWGSNRYPEFEWSVLFCSLAYLHNMRDLERGLTSTKMAWHGLAKYSLKMSYIWVEVHYTINQLSHDISPLWRRILWRVIWMRQLFQFRGKLPIWCFLSKIVASYLIRYYTI